MTCLDSIQKLHPSARAGSGARAHRLDSRGVRGAGGRETIRFAFAKPEAIPYMRELVAGVQQLAGRGDRGARHLRHRRGLGGVRPRRSARHRAEQLQPGDRALHPALRHVGSLRHGGGAERPGGPDPVHGSVRRLPRPHERDSVLGHGRCGDLQQGDLRAERSRSAHHVGRAHRRVRDAPGGGGHSVLRNLRRQLDDRAGLVRLHRGRHARHARILRRPRRGGCERRAELGGLIPEGSGRTRRQDARAVAVRQQRRPEPHLWRWQHRDGQGRSRDVPAGPVGVRRDREGGSRSRTRDVPAAGHRRPRRPQGPDQHGPRRLDPRGLRTRKRHARSSTTSTSRRSSRSTTRRNWASCRPRMLRLCRTSASSVSRSTSTRATCTRVRRSSCPEQSRS